MSRIERFEYDFDQDEEGEATLDVKINGVKIHAKGPMVLKLAALASGVLLLYEYLA